MSLQDEHLKKALRNAPDNDAAPNDATRRQVLDYATKASKQAGAHNSNVTKQSWLLSSLSRIWQNINSWPVTAVSGAMTAMLVVAVFWEQQPKQPVFSTNESDQMDVAQAKQAPESLDRTFNAKPTAKLKRRKAVEKEPLAKAKKNDLPVSDNASAGVVALEAEERVAAPPPVLERENAFEMADKQVVEVANPPERPKTVMPETATTIAEAQKEAKVIMAEKDADAEVSGRAGLPRKEVADIVIAANEKNKAKLEGAAARASTTVASAPVTMDEIAVARALGNANALKDIAAGNLRIITLANTRFKKRELTEDVGLSNRTLEPSTTLGSGVFDESVVANDTINNTADEVTGYRLEVITGRPATEAVKAEIGAYNASMRAHYQKQSNAN
jgi:hypothetical protein